MVRTRPASEQGPQRRTVAVLGAGPAGLAAAWALTDPAVRDRHDVHIYQMGWRAGGKSASARNTDAGARIEQNGSHYLFGCYHHAFALVRQAYQELGKRAGFGRIEDEFTGRNLVVGKHPRGDGTWEDWFQYMPANLSSPGLGGKYARPFDYLLSAFQVFFRILLGFLDYGDEPERTARWVMWFFPLSPFKQDDPGEEWRGRAMRAVLFVPALIVNGPLAGLCRLLLRAAIAAYDLLLSTYTKYWLRVAANLWLQTLTLEGRLQSRRAWAAIARFAAELDLGAGWSGRIRRMTVLFEIGWTLLVGVTADGLWSPGALERIDAEDFRAWLRRHGGGEDAVGSAYIKCWYDAVIAYEDGDPARPSISAAVSLYAAFRAIATYKGNFAFQMRHEVGDGIIAPVVQALINRGVTFHFFHRVRDVVPGVDRRGQPVIDEIVLEPQLPDGVRMTTCFVPDGNGRPVWPHRPQLDGACAEDNLESFYGADSGRRLRLRRGASGGADGFDDVVFALPLPVIPHDAPSLLRQPRWLRMVETVKATESVSLRIWFRWNLQQLGWSYPTPILSGYQSPFSTWEDNCHNISNEGFPAGKEPKAIATVFGPLPAPPFAPGPGPGGDVYVRAQEAAARSTAWSFFNGAAGQLWNKLHQPDGQLFYEAFCDLRQPDQPPDAGLAQRLDWQLLRANVGPIERYTMALPGTLAFRLRPDESGYGNMVLAGEWTRNGVEVGSVEGAVVSGLAAGRALGDRPIAILGERDLEFGLLARAAGGDRGVIPGAGLRLQS